MLQPDSGAGLPDWLLLHEPETAPNLCRVITHPGCIPLTVCFMQSIPLAAVTRFPKDMPVTLLTFPHETYDYTLALLLMPEAKSTWERWANEDDDSALCLDQSF